MSSIVEDVIISPTPPQPDFQLMAACMRNSSQANETLAVQLSRMGNVPAFDHGSQILEGMRVLQEQVNELKVSLDRGLGNICLRLDAS